MLQKQEYVGLLIAAARRRLRQVVSVEARQHGLSAQEFWVLLAAHELRRASMGAIADRQRLDLPTVSRVVARLARRGLLKLGAAREDRRRATIAPTPAGARLAARLRAAAKAVRTAPVHGFTADEHAELRRLLLKVIDNLDERFPNGSGSGGADT